MCEHGLLESQSEGIVATKPRTVNEVLPLLKMRTDRAIVIFFSCFYCIAKVGSSEKLHNE